MICLLLLVLHLRSNIALKFANTFFLLLLLFFPPRQNRYKKILREDVYSSRYLQSQSSQLYFFSIYVYKRLIPRFRTSITRRSLNPSLYQLEWISCELRYSNVVRRVNDIHVDENRFPHVRSTGRIVVPASGFIVAQLILVEIVNKARNEKRGMTRFWSAFRERKWLVYRSILGGKLAKRSPPFPLLAWWCVERRGAGN